MQDKPKSTKTGKPRGRPRGKPFVKGNADGRAGRPKLPDEIKDIRAAARLFSVDALRTLDKIMMSSEIDARARASAAQALIDRGWGRPAQAVTGENGEGPIKVGLIVLPAERDDD